MTVNRTIMLENSRIGFRNFSGKGGTYNPEGKRNFCVFLNDDVAKAMEEEGWNVKWLEPRETEPDEPKQAYLPVALNFGQIPPKVVLITSRGQSILDEDSVNILDWADIQNVDLVIRPYNWGPIQGKSGVKAYVKHLYVTIVEDEFEKKYADVPDSAASAIEDHNINEEELPF